MILTMFGISEEKYLVAVVLTLAKQGNNCLVILFVRKISYMYTCSSYEHKLSIKPPFILMHFNY